ncbi:hypothetical protein [Psychromicrobium xiongbiense]|uniref:hypothetical protein n=1 Tax=Psychromicrobium xiongbiense TaxID=3051184 RepID=UPI00255552CB|nr:hypothetical protein [Psychromicrobium sp. YIM S02556]
MADLGELEAKVRQAKLAAESAASLEAAAAEAVRRDFLHAAQSRGIKPTPLYERTMRVRKIFKKLIYGMEYIADGWAYHCSRDYFNDRSTDHHFHCSFITTKGELYSFDFGGGVSDDRMQQISAYSYKVLGADPIVGGNFSGPRLPSVCVGDAGRMAEYLASFDS